MKFKRDVLEMIYGANGVAIGEKKSTKEQIIDAGLFLVANDVTKIEDVKKMKMTDILDLLSSKLVEYKVNKDSIKRNPLGYK